MSSPAVIEFMRTLVGDARIDFADAHASRYQPGHFLTAHDDEDNVVAVAGVWSAGSGRPGLLEPIGVHPDHRRHGHGRAITLAAAAALRELESSSAIVCTPTANPGAVTTYESAGFERFPDARDLRRGD